MEIPYTTLPFTEDGSPAWLAQRAQGIGGSDVGTLMGMQRSSGSKYFRSPLALYYEKIGQGIPTVRDANDAWFARVGHAFEEVIFQWLDDTHGGDIIIHPPMAVHPEHPWALGSLDGLWKPVGRDWIGVEIKRPVSFSADAWKDGPPSHVMAQVLWYMAVTGMKEWIVIAVIGDSAPKSWTIKADPEWSANALEVVGKFWNENVLARVAPMPSPRWQDSGADSDAMTARHDPASVETIAANAEDARIASAIKYLTAKEKELSGVVKALRNRLVHRVGEDAKGIKGTGWSASYSTRKGRVSWSKLGKALIDRGLIPTETMDALEVEFCGASSQSFTVRVSKLPLIEIDATQATQLLENMDDQS